jgi:AcrR family transcriptional regulator
MVVATGVRTDPGPVLGERVTSAALRCVARWGVAKTTIDDIAREAGCSRATIYRLFPGGKHAVLAATGQAELVGLLGALAARLDRTSSLDQLLAVALSEAVTAVRCHEALQYLIAHEPGQVLTYLAFHALDPLLELATAFGRPYLEPYVGDAAEATAEWLTRLIVSYAIEPEGTDLSHPAEAARVVETFVLPGLAPFRSPPAVA